MKRIVLLLSVCVFFIGGCKSSQKVQISKEEYEQLKGISEDITIPDDSIQSVVESLAPDFGVEPQEMLLPKENVDNDINDWTLVDFKDPYAQISIPTYITKWGRKEGHPSGDDHAHHYEADNHVNLQIIVNCTIIEEPEKIDDAYIESTSDPRLGEVCDWSYKDHLLKKYMVGSGGKRFYAAYWGNGYTISLHAFAPEDIADRYAAFFEDCETIADKLGEVDVQVNSNE